MPPFYMDTQLEEAPMREKIGAPGSGDGKPRRRHRGGRRRGGAKSGEGVEQPKAEARGPEKKEGRAPSPQTGEQACAAQADRSQTWGEQGGGPGR